jgi:hypothetical protein
MHGRDVGVWQPLYECEAQAERRAPRRKARTTLATRAEVCRRNVQDAVRSIARSSFASAPYCGWNRS